MILHFKKVELPSEAVSIMAYFKNDYHIIGFIPDGFISRIDAIMEYEDDLVISLERLNCDQVSDSLWVTLDELPSIKQIELALSSEPN